MIADTHPHFGTRHPRPPRNVHLWAGLVLCLVVLDGLASLAIMPLTGGF